MRAKMSTPKFGRIFGKTSASFLALTALVALSAACSGGGTSVSAATTSSPTPTTAAPTTTTLPPTTTTTTTLPPILAQLTGLETATTITRPAAVVKIDNHVNASPQWGLNQADVVFEEIVEGSITRFAAVFHSQDAQRIGPIRSARTGDFDLLRNLNKPIFVNSGANEAVWSLLRREDAIVVSDRNIGRTVFSRTSDKYAPHNLVTSTELLYGARPGEGGTPPALFQYRTANEQPANSIAAGGVDIDFGSTPVKYRWNPTTASYDRTHYGNAHFDYSGARISPTNVIVQFVAYGQSAASSITPEPHLVGTGEALVLSGGRATNATWQRASSTAVTQFFYPSGETMKLAPGSTWVGLARVGSANVVS